MTSNFQDMQIINARTGVLRWLARYHAWKRGDRVFDSQHKAGLSSEAEQPLWRHPPHTGVC
jgi:hypothetical protein